MKHVIQAPVRPGPFEGHQVATFFHHADLVLVALGVGADLARRGIGEVAAQIAEHQAVPRLQDSLGQRPGLLFREPDDVVCDALGALGADAGQPVELIYKPAEGPGGAGAVLADHDDYVAGYPPLTGIGCDRAASAGARCTDARRRSTATMSHSLPSSNHCR